MSCATILGVWDAPMEVAVTARETWKRQEDLKDADRALEQVARDWHAMATSPGAMVGTQDYLDGPEAKAVEALRTEVRAMQDAVGGVVYRVPSENAGVLCEKLDKLVKRAAKLGVAEVSYRRDAEVEYVKRDRDPLLDVAELGYVPRYAKSYRYVVLNAGVVKLAGWMFLATLTVEPGGVMVSKVPAFARAWALHREGAAAHAPRDEQGDEMTDAAKASLEAMDLSEWRDEKRATTCEHCGTARKRTKTYLVESVETGVVKVVGSNCLRDFLGADPHNVARYAEYLADIEAAMDDDEGYGGSGGGRQETLTEEYLTHVCAMLRVHGWAPASDADPTKHRAWSNLRNYGKVERGHPLYDELVEDDHARAVAAISWAKEHLGAKVHQSRTASDFEHNMYVAANGDTVPKKGDGVLAYLPVAHARFLEREIERRERDERVKADDEASDWVGEVKDRVEVTARVVSVFEYGREDDGVTFITKLRDEAGNVYKWFGSYRLGLDEVVTAKWTVKGHDEYKGVKETVLTRPSGMRDASKPEPVKPTKRGERVPVTVEINGAEASGEVEKVERGFKVYVAGTVLEAPTWKKAQEVLAFAWHDAERDRKRAEYLNAGLPEGAAAKRGSYNPYTDYSNMGFQKGRYVQDGEMVALRAKRDGDYSSYVGEWVPARPPSDNDAELVWVPAEVVWDNGYARATAVGPDDVPVPLGESEVIVMVAAMERSR